jgi:hypothetical protein
MENNPDEVIALIRCVVSERECDVETARRLESSILKHFPDADDDETFQDLMYVLACYEPRPDRDEYLVGTSELIKECEWVLSRLKGTADTPERSS